MKQSRPPDGFFYVSVVLAIIAILVFFGTLSLDFPPFWLMTAAYVVLLIGTVTNN